MGEWVCVYACVCERDRERVRDREKESESDVRRQKTKENTLKRKSVINIEVWCTV